MAHTLHACVPDLISSW